MQKETEGTERNVVTYMESQWVQVDDNILTVGMTEEGMQDIAEILKVDFPSENEEVRADEVCGEFETDEAPIQFYSPVKGTILEINTAVAENPTLIIEDPYGDGWLFRIECENAEEIEDFLASADKGGLSYSTDDDDDDDDDDMDDDVDEDEELEDDVDEDDASPRGSGKPTPGKKASAKDDDDFDIDLDDDLDVDLDEDLDDDVDLDDDLDDDDDMDDDVDSEDELDDDFAEEIEDDEEEVPVKKPTTKKAPASKKPASKKKGKR